MARVASKAHAALSCVHLVLLNMGCIKNPRVLAVLSGIIGALSGAFISLVVDSSLFEISVNGFFSFVFGVSLMLIGAMILFRVLPQPGQTINAVRVFIIGFSILVIFSGLFCFFLERDWITVLKPNAKIPMYIVLGTSLCFALTFSIVDLVNQGRILSFAPSVVTPSRFAGICSECPCAGEDQSEHRRVSRPIQPYMQSSAQMSVILVGSIVMGAVFGFSFGLLDVEDDTWQHQRFSKDQSIASCRLCKILMAVLRLICYCRLGRHYRRHHRDHQSANIAATARFEQPRGCLRESVSSLSHLCNHAAFIIKLTL